MAVTHYTWDPEFDCITKETDAAGAVTARYTQEPKLYGGLVSQHRSGASSFYHYDAIGTTRALTDSSQNVTDTAVYTAFGEKGTSTGTTANRFEFVGRLGYCTSVSTTNADVRARNYQPRLAHWLSKDPLIGSEDAMEEDGIAILNLEPNKRKFYDEGRSREHAYLYSKNNPTSRVDPSGLKCKCPGCNWTFGGASGNFSAVVGYSYARVNARCSKAELRAYRVYDCGEGIRIRKPIHCYCEANLSFHVPSLGLQGGGNWIKIFGSFVACTDAKIFGCLGWSMELTVLILGVEAGGDFSGTPTGDYGGGGFAPGLGVGVNLNWTFINIRTAGLVCTREPLLVQERVQIRQFGPCTSHDERVTPPKVVDNPYSIRPPGSTIVTE